MSSTPPTTQELRDVADKAVSILETHGLSCCLFGSLGCELYGRNRVPKDVDLIVMTNDPALTTEALKDILVKDRRFGRLFYTRPSRTPGATYRLLHCHLPGRKRSCKVDILIPGILNIPFVLPHRIVHIDNLPVLPFLVLLILKVQGWKDHIESSRQDFRAKVDIDVRDVNEMLSIGRRRREHFGQERWIPSSFMSHGIILITEFVEHNGGTRKWELIGLDFAP